jgi:hypothetical protein
MRTSPTGSHSNAAPLEGTSNLSRAVVQPGRTHAWGASVREFESRQPDHGLRFLRHYDADAFFGSRKKSRKTTSTVTAIHAGVAQMADQSWVMAPFGAASLC